LPSIWNPFVRDHQGQIMLDFGERYESDQGTHLSDGVYIRTTGPVMINSPVSGRVIFYGY
jgi:septal ring factor EnvC (AmiA/AmiB activator)